MSHSVSQSEAASWLCLPGSSARAYRRAARPVERWDPAKRLRVARERARLRQFSVWVLDGRLVEDTGLLGEHLVAAEPLHQRVVALAS